jgi:phage/plasmid-associated DNA primase
MELLEEPVVAPVAPSFAWSLNKCLFADTIFGKKKLVEYADIKKVYGFIKNEMGITFQGNKRYELLSTIDATELEQIKRFKELYNKKLKAFQTAVFLPKHKWGRIIPANNYLSLSIFHRPTRHSLCEDYYIDIDMINAQPTIISEISKINDIPVPWLDKYVKKPKKYREFIMKHHNCNKDCAKNLPIVLMFGGSYDGWIREWDIQMNIEKGERIKDIIEIEKELKSIMELVYANNQHIKKDVLKQDPKKWKTDAEAKRGVMSLWSQSIERLFQETAIKYLVDSKGFKLENIVPCQDGFMILKDLWYDTILEDIECVISDKYGISIKFLNKPFDEAIEIPEYEEDKPVDEWEDLLSAKKLADKFVEEFGNYVVKYKSNIYVFYGNRWFDETDNKKQHKLTLYISEKLYDVMKDAIDADVGLKEKDKIKVLKILRTNTSAGSKMSDIIKHILSKVKEVEEDFNANPFLIGFNNGVYDLLADEFRDYKFDDYITLTTKYDYINPDYDDPDIISIKEELVSIFEMIQPDPESRLLYLQVLASGLDGRPYQKLFLFNGQGGNGKGLTGGLMDITLGDYYHQPSNGILKDVEKANTPSPDMINLKNKRYINFKEVQGAVRVAMLRNLTGGGKFSGRFLNQNPETFFMSGTFVMEFNVAPELDGKPQRADYRRLIDLLFPVNFTDDPTKIGKEIGGVQYKKANPYYETQEFLHKVKLVFLDMLLGVYREYKEGVNGIIFTIPESIRLRTEKFLENQNLFQKVFNDIWVKVEINKKEDGSIDKEDEKKKTIQVKEIWESITSSEEYRKLNYREKRQYGRDEFYKWIESLYTITGDKKTGKLVVGLGRKTMYDDVDKPDDDDNVFDGNTDAETELIV